ncbi:MULTISPECIES: OmpA family protein [unclassified Cellulophaga]|uniref:OmpA family protein n=1 Tax=unclassified Cellulophaga TaxID=2634405 RepID=UPI0026E1C1AB|nr:MULTISPECIES: OmpA family protein [unclassified Cellulophaga]MDO6491460.1 OmpA family protein [Cellulophaga sp. 2_MG-2023]MDO6493337.1 OmpA family protein [Cellulophaga sp. 3_MG-2023]
MKKIKIGVLVILLHSIGSVWAQDLQLTAKDSIVKSSWIFGLGYNFVDDSGDVFDELLDVDKQWNAVAFPSRISIGKYFESGIGVEAIGSYNKYKVGKTVDGSVNLEETDYYAVDTRVSYDLNKIIGETAWFDPYLGVGLGYTDANNKGRGTYNGVLGFRTWITERIGLDFNSSGKWAMNKGDGVTNHLQHAVGVVYQFKVEKGLSKKGLEKQAQIEEILKEQQRVADSTAIAKKQEEEARLLAEQLKKEQEALRLVEAEKEKAAAQKKRREDLQAKINSFGSINFALNSSYLDPKTKKTLNSIAELLKENSTVTVKLGAYTDSRGTDKYNLWLSQRRMQRSLDYIISKGVVAEKVTAKAYGEEVLLNNCEDDVYCTEQEHSINRRIEIIIDKI